MDTGRKDDRGRQYGLKKSEFGLRQAQQVMFILAISVLQSTTVLFARHHGGSFLLRVEDTDKERSTKDAVDKVFEALNWLGLDYDEEPLYQSKRINDHIDAAEKLLSQGLAYKSDKGATGQGEAIVFKMPGTDMVFTDEIKGKLRKPAESLKDFVIMRSNGTPVFHLANVLDDIEMGITHVIRGDDHIENTYRHVALYKAIGRTNSQFRASTNDC